MAMLKKSTLLQKCVIIIVSMNVTHVNATINIDSENKILIINGQRDCENEIAKYFGEWSSTIEYVRFAMANLTEEHMEGSLFAQKYYREMIPFITQGEVKDPNDFCRKNHFQCKKTGKEAAQYAFRYCILRYMDHESFSALYVFLLSRHCDYEAGMISDPYTYCLRNYGRKMLLLNTNTEFEYMEIN